MLTWLSIIVLCKATEVAFARHPTLDAKVEHLVKSFGYPFETHEITTTDGYILGIHRIPGKDLNNVNGANRPPVLMMHGLLGSSPDWLTTGPNTSLAFLLHDRGYDVWLGNNRGTTYSKNHTTLDPKSNIFWDFSWNELGLYDTPALIDYVLAATGYPKLYYIGFSQGCTQFYVMASMRPEYNDKVILMISLAPAAFTGNVKGLLLSASTFVDMARIFSETTNYFEVTPDSKFLEKSLTFICRKEVPTEPLCKMSIYMVAGMSLKEEWNENDLPIILQFVPAGCSSKQLLHYGMGIRNPGQFRQYDYGPMKNFVTYKSFSPPDYPLHKITTPVEIYSGVNDWLVHPNDVELLVKKLPNVIGWHEVNVKVLNHFDFIFGNSIRSLVYNHVLERMESYLPVTN